MRPPMFIQCIPAICAAILLVACGGESANEPAAPDALASPITPVSSNPPLAPPQSPAYEAGGTFWLQAPEANPRTMQAFSNLGSTCYANSALKFLIHSTGTKRLVQHLNTFAGSADAPQREAAQAFVQLIESSYSETMPTRQELENFFAALQKLPAFSSLDDAQVLDFPLVGEQQDANRFLTKLSQAFALHSLHAEGIALQDDANAFKKNEEYWTVLQPLSANDTLQEVLDRTRPGDWKLKLDHKAPHLTVRMENAIRGDHTLLSNRNFNFNETVQLQVLTRGGRTRMLTLEPREVVEFRGSDNAGHYLVYVKDGGQWFQHNDELVTALDQMPSIDNARLINFAITKIAPGNSTVQ